MSQDPLMLDAFEEKKDIHTMVASRMFEKPETEINKKERRAAKAVNFGMLFGMGPRSLGKNLEISFAEAKAFHAKHKAEFARVHGWLQEVVFNATNDGYTTTWWGRKRWIGGIYSNSPMVKTHAQRTALNAPIQGTAADIIKLSMIIVQQAIDAAGLSADIKMILQVHDEIVFEVNTNKVNQAVILIKQAMESVVGVVPVNIARKVSLDVDVEIGQQYGHMEKWVG